MSRRALTAALLIPFAVETGGEIPPPQSETTAFVGVSVLPMDRERVLADHTVLVVDGVIQTAAPSHRVQVPEGARVISGEGLYLLPALADMHVRLPAADTHADVLAEEMFLYLASGIATIRAMDGDPAGLRLKSRVASADLTGPTIYVGSPPLSQGEAYEPAAAVARMMANRSSGYDFQITPRHAGLMAWDSMAEEAHSRGYTFGGLVPDSVGLRHALSTGVSTIEHLDGYLEEVASDEIRARLARGQKVPLHEIARSAEGRRMRAIAAHTRGSDTWVVPTMYRVESTLRAVALGEGAGSDDLPELRYVSPASRRAWAVADPGAGGGEAGGVIASGGEPGGADAVVEARRRILRALTMAGVGVLLGTDSPGPLAVPGFSLRRELECMEAAGLTPYEVLVTGTRNVAEYAAKELREAGNFGTIQEGNRADLLVLRANPFETLDALWDQEGVMLGGRWIAREEIDQRLAAMAQKHGGGS